MKGTLLILIFTISSIFAIGQARFGYSVNEIKSEFSDKKYNLSGDYGEDGIYHLIIQLPNANIIYLFDADKICNTTIVGPFDQNALNYYVEYYNKNYVVISPTEWRMYAKQGFFNAKLVFPAEGEPFFVWE